MWPWLKRWRDWAMHDLWPMQRLGYRPQALHFSYEKAGLTVHDQPIPWNAEAVVVEALVSLRGGRLPTDFQLRVPGLDDPIAPETTRAKETDERLHLFFRLPAPTQSLSAELLWRSTSLGQVTLPVLSRDEFIASLRVHMPVLFVQLGHQSVACQTFVATQCRGLMASAVIGCPTSLAPLRDLGLHVEFRPEKRGSAITVTAPLSNSQLSGRNALISLIPPKFPRRTGAWTITWMVGGQPVLTHRFRAISLAAFQKSLRICDTRFLVQSAKHGIRVVRHLPPLEPDDRVGPCFLVASGEAGMAGLCTLKVIPQVAGTAEPSPLSEPKILITDGPTLVVPGTVAMNDLDEVRGFELHVRDTLLGGMSLTPAPEATFSSEGGFKPVDDFLWSTAAEEELSKRLGQLMDGKRKE